MHVRGSWILLVIYSCVCLSLAHRSAGVRGADRWQRILDTEIKSEFSETRHKALRQVDTTTVKGLRALWGVLDKIAPKDPLMYDWYVRQGAYHALMEATGDEALAEIESLLESKGHENSKEAVVYSIIWKIRTQFEKDEGGNDDKARADAKYRLSKARGVDYFKLVMPTVRKVDRKRQRFRWIKTAFADKSSQVRLAAITGFMAYPRKSSIPLLLKNLQRLEAKRDENLKEWAFTRHALETLTGQYFRDDVDDWVKWWSIAEGKFSIKKRVKKETGKKKKNRKTRVVKAPGLEVRLNMKIAGKGYPLLVLPWQGFEPDYFRPYFHGVEEFLKVYYVQMPQVEDFKGLARDSGTGTVVYPTDQLAEALAETMEGEIPEKFAILSHGPSASTLAMKMTARFADQISHLILINPASAGGEYMKSLQTVERRGRAMEFDELVHGAQNLIIKRDGKPTYEEASADEAAGMGRALYNVKFAQPASPEVGALQFLYRVPTSTQLFNDSKWDMRKIFSRKAPRLPILVMHGAEDPWAPVADVSKVKGFLKRCKFARFTKSAQNPFMFETSRFTRVLQAFCAKSGIQSAKKKKRKKKRKARERSGKKSTVSKED